MRKSEAPTPIKSLLETCVDRAAGAPGAAAIWQVWDACVGAAVARRAQPVRLRGRTLIVAVSSAPWMQELQLLKPAIRTELNARLATPLVEDLFFVLTAVGDEPAERSRAAATSPPCPPSPAHADLMSLPEGLREGFDELLAAWERRARH